MRQATLGERVGQVLVKVAPKTLAAALDGLRETYADDLVFHDPIQIVRGLPDFLAMNERLVGRMKTLEWTILGTWSNADDESACIEWNMTGKPKLGPVFSVDGMSRVTARAGRVTQHRDYWDLGELAASGVPGGQKILRTLLRPFA